jgi:general secretion pathway protein G
MTVWRRLRGFTLLEMLVVLALIGLLAGISVPIYLGRAEAARISKVESDFATIATALRLYELDNRALPTTEQGLAALVSKPQRSPVPPRYKNGGYLREVPVDPWDKPYQYLAPSRDGARAFELVSLGADGRAGGSDSNADLHD